MVSTGFRRWGVEKRGVVPRNRNDPAQRDTTPAQRYPRLRGANHRPDEAKNKYACDRNVNGKNPTYSRMGGDAVHHDHDAQPAQMPPVTPPHDACPPLQSGIATPAPVSAAGTGFVSARASDSQDCERKTVKRLTKARAGYNHVNAIHWAHPADSSMLSALRTPPQTHHDSARFPRI